MLKKSLKVQIANEMLCKQDEIEKMVVNDKGEVDFYYCNQYWWGHADKRGNLKKNSIRRNNW